MTSTDIAAAAHAKNSPPPAGADTREALRKDIRWLLDKVEGGFHDRTEVKLSRRDLQRVSKMLRGVQDAGAKALGYE